MALAGLRTEVAVDVSLEKTDVSVEVVVKVVVVMGDAVCGAVVLVVIDRFLIELIFRSRLFRWV